MEQFHNWREDNSYLEGIETEFQQDLLQEFLT